MSAGGGQVDDLAAELDALVARGPRSRAALIRLADRGDWPAQVLALSALGRLVRDDAAAGWPAALAGTVLARLPGLRRHVPTMGRHGRLVSASLLNGTTAPTFAVRTAAALALAECRDPALKPVFGRLLTDAFRPVRLAAATALAILGDVVDSQRLDTPGEATPAVIGDGQSTVAWLTRLCAAHEALLGGAAAPHGLGPSPGAAALAAWLAGPLATYGGGGAAAEAGRYEHEADLAHQLAKPFGSRDRAENLRQLDAFIALVSHLQLPRGARVLDLGGGSGWVSELLARFGFRPVVVDVSPALLRLSARRFAAQRLDGRVVAADMTALPFADGAIDAAMVIDALHHVDGVAAVLQEVRRVLGRGGLFLIGEPGEGHAEAAKSLAEGREHGVRESEVHPLTLARLAAAAGFDRVDILPRLPASAVMAVSDLRAAMRAPADRWPVRDQGTRAQFDVLALRSMLARPLMVLSAGQRPPDSRAPGSLRAAIRPALRRHGARVVGRIEIDNTGDTLWLAAAPGEPGAVQLGLQLLGADGRMLERELGRVPLLAPVPPGGGCALAVDAALPDDHQRFGVKIDLVAEGVCWFEDRGSRAITVEL